MALSAVAPCMRGNAFAAMKYLNRPRRGAGGHLLADQRVRHRVEEALHLDVIVDADTGEVPLGIFEVILRQRLHERPFDLLEQLAAAHAQEAPHLAAVHPLPRGAGDGGVALGQGEKRDVAQPAKDISCAKRHPRFDHGLIPRASRPGWQDADAL